MYSFFWGDLLHFHRKKTVRPRVLPQHPIFKLPLWHLLQRGSQLLLGAQHQLRSKQLLMYRKLVKVGVPAWNNYYVCNCKTIIIYYNYIWLRTWICKRPQSFRRLTHASNRSNHSELEHTSQQKSQQKTRMAIWCNLYILNYIELFWSTNVNNKIRFHWTRYDKNKNGTAKCWGSNVDAPKVGLQ